MTLIPKIQHCLAPRSILVNLPSGCPHSTFPIRNGYSPIGSARFYKSEPLASSISYKAMNDDQSIEYPLHQPVLLNGPFRYAPANSKSSVKQVLDHMSQPFHFSSLRYDPSRKRLSRTSTSIHPRTFSTTLISLTLPGGSTDGIFPYSDTDNTDFNRCKNPAQLEKTIESYLKSHPTPADQALVAMLTACADLTRATISPSHHQHRDQTNNAPSQISAHKKRKSKSVPLESRSNDFKSNFLQTILDSIEFTSNDVFEIACSIYYGIPAGSYPGNERQHTITHIKPSLEVTNAFLHVCAISGHFDQAWLILEDMMDRKQGDIKPNLTTYRYVLKAASVQRQKLSDQALDVADIDVKTEKILDYASSSLSKQSQVALWMKLGLGGLVGATVGKFTMMGIMALPSSSILNGLSEPKEGEGSMIIDSYQSGEGIIHFLATQEVALGIGLITGLLTTGYYIRLNTLSSRADPAQEQVIRSRNQYFREDLPRARLFGLSFPDLKTTNKDEIREYLRRNADL